MPGRSLCAELCVESSVIGGDKVKVLKNDGTASADELHDPVGTSRIGPGLQRPASCCSQTHETLKVLIQMLHEQQAAIKSEIQAQHSMLRGVIEERLEHALKDSHHGGNGQHATEFAPLLANGGEAPLSVRKEYNEELGDLRSSGMHDSELPEPEHIVVTAPDEDDVQEEVDKQLKDSQSRFSMVSMPSMTDLMVSFDRKTCSGRLKTFVAGHNFDILSGTFVILNTAVMCIDLDRQAVFQARDLGIPATSIWEHSGDAFEVLEHIFNVIFVIELLLRFWVFGRKLCCELSILFDAFIVATSCFDAYVMPHLQSSGGGQANLAFARLARLLRVIRVLRAFRAAALFSELRILIRTLISSVMALVWSALLLGMLILSSGVLMAQLMAGFITDQDANFDHRVWSYKHYGGASRSTWTMFEATLSGGWPNYARPVLENVSAAYALFWVIYVVGVVFAVIRVISALFLRTTMTAAANDDEMMVMGKMKEKDKYAKKLRKFFSQADTSGDGLISREEFAEIMKDVKVQAWLQVLELEVYEVTALFNLLDDGNGEINCDEFVGGALRLKGNARAIDSITIMHEQVKMLEGIKTVHNGLRVLWGKMFKENKDNPWLAEPRGPATTAMVET